MLCRLIALLRHTLSSLLLILSTATSLIAQTVAATETHLQAPYTPQAWDINWTYLAAPGAGQDWTDRLHYLPIGEDPADFLSINGHIRERGEYQDHPALDAQPADNGYLLATSPYVPAKPWRAETTSAIGIDLPSTEVPLYFSDNVTEESGTRLLSIRCCEFKLTHYP